MHKLIKEYMYSHQYDWRAPDNNLAIIIEDRPTPNLEWVIRNINHHTGFNIRHYGSNFTSLPIENRKLSINTFDDYNELLTSREFWDELPENVLIFQSDSFMLKDWDPKFEQYDYIGSPWKWSYDYNNCKSFQVGGNGGISFRKTSTMKKIIEQFPTDRYRTIRRNPKGNEDMYYTMHLQDVRANIPPLNIQKQFGVESIYCNSPMCVHAIDKWLDDDEIKTILSND